MCLIIDIRGREDSLLRTPISISIGSLVLTISCIIVASSDSSTLMDSIIINKAGKIAWCTVFAHGNSNFGAQTMHEQLVRVRSQSQSLSQEVALRGEGYGRTEWWMLTVAEFSLRCRQTLEIQAVVLLVTYDGSHRYILQGGVEFSAARLIDRPPTAQGARNAKPEGGVPPERVILVITEHRPGVQRRNRLAPERDAGMTDARWNLDRDLGRDAEGQHMHNGGEKVDGSYVELECHQIRHLGIELVKPVAQNAAGDSDSIKREGSFTAEERAARGWIERGDA
ncbi:hypothetical protein DFH09DRAFT_1103452 [Mycena vulgaris]|nr:hypothetical protein DFH09DRAFT_1103452 [Mycena vulgaris]